MRQKINILFWRTICRFRLKFIHNGFFWHAYHEDKALFYLYDASDRIRDITKSKRLCEQATRFKLFKRVKIIFPTALLADIRTYADADSSIYSYYLPMIKEAHAKECGCKFFEQGNNIFPLAYPNR